MSSAKREMCTIRSEQAKSNSIGGNSMQASSPFSPSGVQWGYQRPSPLTFWTQTQEGGSRHAWRRGGRRKLCERETWRSKGKRLGGHLPPSPVTPSVSTASCSVPNSVSTRSAETRCRRVLLRSNSRSTQKGLPARAPDPRGRIETRLEKGREAKASPFSPSGVQWGYQRPSPLTFWTPYYSRSPTGTFHQERASEEVLGDKVPVGDRL
jgi:hypothetical protein